MSFLDEDDDLFAERRPGPPPRAGASEGRQMLARRLIALGVGLGVAIILVLGFRGCLNARKERAFKDYVRDVQALTEESGQISEDFFNSLEDPGDVTPLDFQSAVNSNRGAADVLVSRVRKLDPPDQMKRAQTSLVLVFELRRDALKSISEDLDTALGREGRREAIARIAGQMQALLASDVIYSQRTFPEMQKGLRKEGIGEVEVPESRFMPPTLDWLSPVQVTEALAKVRGRTGEKAAAPGVHGTGLIRVLAIPGDIELNKDTPVAARIAPSPGLKVEVQNQGESDETDIVITVSVSGGARPIQLERSVDRIAAGETKAINIPISPAPPRGEPLEVTVSIEAVPGEKVTDNNSATYSVTYG